MANEENRVLWPGWETVRLIGRGSFGAVYEIRRDMLGETERAALKRITIPENPSEVEMLMDEGYDDASIASTYREHLKSIVGEYSLMRKLNGCSNVVNCDDVRYEQQPDGIGWDIYIKMELLTSLPKALDREIPDSQVIRIGTDLCRALILCSKHNIIHRDIKPANIFVSENGDYKLGDFGIAKTVEKTSGGTKIGTYEYMAPEVYRDLPYGSGADLYSLGMVLYWLLNERRTPFLPLPPATPTAGEKEQARRRRFDGEAIPAPAHGSPALQRVVLKAIAFDPRDRYRSAEEMLRDLENLEFEMKPMRNSESGCAATVSAVGAAISRPPLRETPESDRRDDPCGHPPVPTHGPRADEDAAVSAAQASPAPAKTPSAPAEAAPQTENPVKEEAPKQKEKSMPVEKPAHAEIEPAPSAKPGKKKWLSILIGVAALGLVLVFMLLPKGGSSTNYTYLKEAAVGDYVTFGAYEQDNNTSNGKEPIEWLVLAKEDDRILVISRYALDYKPYHEKTAIVTWEACSLRSWLNGTFLGKAFSTGEQGMILLSPVKADKNPYFTTTSPGRDTEDKVFLLSVSEVEEYFASAESRRCALTNYVIPHVRYHYSFDSNGFIWWLRSPGSNAFSAAYVNSGGGIGSYSVEEAYVAVRPAMWIKLGS